jgi:outer membrane lipoprotein SlyB
MPSVKREARRIRLNLLACQGVIYNSTSSAAAEEIQVRYTLLPAAFAFSMTAGWVPVHAAGCLKGAAVGGVAGHFAGHHGVLGAGAGCIIGHHEATKHAREKAQQPQ